MVLLADGLPRNIAKLSSSTIISLIIILMIKSRSKNFLIKSRGVSLGVNNLPSFGENNRCIS